MVTNFIFSSCANLPNLGTAWGGLFLLNPPAHHWIKSVVYLFFYIFNIESYFYDRFTVEH